MRLAHTAVAFVVVLVLAQPAIALPPGVYIAPGSPAGKEYSFPLSVLRGESGGHTAPGSTAEPLFGVGVKPVVRRGAGTAKAHRASNSAAGHRHRAAGPAASRNQGAQHREAVLASLVRPSSDVPQVVLIAVVLLVVGLAFGTGIAVARRRS